MIDSISLYIGKKLIDTHTGEWLQVWNSLNNSTTKKEIIDKMIGNVPELYDAESKLMELILVILEILTNY